MNWKKISERVFFFILLVGLFFGGWQMISQYFKQQIIEQQESYLSKKGQLLIQQLTIDDLSSKHNQAVLTDKLLEGITDDMPQAAVTAKMTLNCLSLSTSLAVQVVLNLLESVGTLSFDDREIEKLLLKHLSSEIKEK